MAEKEPTNLDDQEDEPAGPPSSKHATSGSTVGKGLRHSKTKAPPPASNEDPKAAMVADNDLPDLRDLSINDDKPTGATSTEHVPRSAMVGEGRRRHESVAPAPKSIKSTSLKYRVPTQANASAGGEIAGIASRALSRTTTTEQPVEKAQVLVEVAFHVTRVSCDQAEPNWEELKWHAADDPYFDGPVLLHAPCVFFITSKYGSGIFTKSLYPRHGNPRESYWCIKVPLSCFDSYEILWIYEITSEEGSTQVRLVLLKEQDARRIKREIRDKLKIKAEKYLRREPIPNGNGFLYYSNDYEVPETKYIVNIVVCESLRIPKSPDWVEMPHGPHKPGSPESETEDEKEKTREEKMDDFIKRINLMEI